MTWFSDNDMPAYVQRDGISRTTTVRWTVRPDGTLQSCDIVEGSGDHKLDVYTCQLVLKRGHYAPARWTDGAPVHGLVEFPFSWFVGVDRPKSRLSSIPEFTVDRFPRGSKSPAIVMTALAVSEKGIVVDCGAGPTQYQGKTDPPELVQLACAQLKTAYHPSIVKNERGQPVRSVQTRSVKFVKTRR